MTRITRSGVMAEAIVKELQRQFATTDLYVGHPTSADGPVMIEMSGDLDITALATACYVASNASIPRGERHANSKLNADIVRMIRSSQKTTLALSAELGVTNQLISLVRRRKRWGHID